MRPALYRIIFITVVLILVAGCASTPGGSTRPESLKPAWVDDPESEYPDELYIATVASGDTEDTARKNASARVALVFKADINSEENLVEEYFETDSAAGGELSKSSSLKKSLQISTRQTLRNLTVPKIWQDPRTRHYYALACLDRNQARTIYEAELIRLDREIGDYYGFYRDAKEKLSQLAYLDKALILAAQRDMMIGQLSIVSRGTRLFTPATDHAALIKARTDLRSRLGLRVQFDDPRRRQFNTSVRAVLEEFGFRIVEQGGDYLLSGGLSLEKLERDGIYVGWHGELHLSDLITGDEILTLGKDGREGHLSYPEAERRAEREATRIISDGLYEKLSAYLDSLLEIKNEQP